MTRREAIAAELGCEPETLQFRGVGGGCTHRASIIETPDGEFFAKWNEHHQSGQFAAEAAGLKVIAQIEGAPDVPEVIALSDADDESNFLLLENVPEGPRVADFDARLGRALAAMHRRSDDRGFGFERDGYCGASPQPNRWDEDWVSFYAEQRLAQQLERCARRGMDAHIVQLGEALIQQLPQRLGEPEPPALIHGDLWSGNLHSDNQGMPALVDPAAYFAHREAELGMMVLFGGFSETVFAAYNEAYPLQAGWRERLPIYTLYHVLNHYSLFGGHYQAQAWEILKKLV